MFEDLPNVESFEVSYKTTTFKENMSRMPNDIHKGTYPPKTSRGGENYFHVKYFYGGIVSPMLVAG